MKTAAGPQLVYSSNTEKTIDRNSPGTVDTSLEDLLGAPTQVIHRQTEKMRNNEEKEEVDQVREENNLLLSQFSTPENRSGQLSTSATQT